MAGVGASKLKCKAPSELTIYTVKSFQEELISKLDNNKDLLLDCQQLEMIDGAGIQLLLSLEKTALNENFGVEYMNLSSEIKKNIELAGAIDLLDFIEEDQKNE